MFPRFSLQSRPTTTSASIDEVTKYTSRIDELNLKNRTLEHSINKLKAELSAEQSRGEAAMREIRSRWELERLEWRQGCDALQAAHRVAHLKIALDAEKEKRTLLEEREINRRERVAVCQRDFRLLMFQIQESNKDARIAQLETELSGVEKSHQSQHQSVRREFQTKLETLQNRYKELRMKFDEKSEELENAVDEKAQLEVCPLVLLHSCPVLPEPADIRKR